MPPQQNNPQMNQMRPPGNMPNQMPPGNNQGQILPLRDDNKTIDILYTILFFLFVMFAKDALKFG